MLNKLIVRDNIDLNMESSFKFMENQIEMLYDILIHSDNSSEYINGVFAQFGKLKKSKNHYENYLNLELIKFLIFKRSNSKYDKFSILYAGNKLNGHIDAISLNNYSFNKKVILNTEIIYFIRNNFPHEFDVYVENINRRNRDESYFSYMSEIDNSFDEILKQITFVNEYYTSNAALSISIADRTIQGTILECEIILKVYNFIANNHVIVDDLINEFYFLKNMDEEIKNISRINKEESEMIKTCIHIIDKCLKLLVENISETTNFNFLNIIKKPVMIREWCIKNNDHLDIIEKYLEIHDLGNTYIISEVRNEKS